MMLAETWRYRQIEKERRSDVLVTVTVRTLRALLLHVRVWAPGRSSASSRMVVAAAWTGSSRAKQSDIRRVVSMVAFRGGSATYQASFARVCLIVT